MSCIFHGARPPTFPESEGHLGVSRLGLLRIEERLKDLAL